MGVLAGRDGGIWVASTGSLDRIEKNGTISFIHARDGLPGSQVTSMLVDRAGDMWVGVDDGLYLFKDGRFRRCPSHITSRLDRWLAWLRTSTEIYGQSAPGIQESWCASAISRCAKSSLHRKFPRAAPSRRIHREGFG